MTMLSATSHAPEHPGNPRGAPMPSLRLPREASADAGTPITDPAEVHEEVESFRAKYGAGSWRRTSRSSMSSSRFRPGSDALTTG